MKKTTASLGYQFSIKTLLSPTISSICECIRQSIFLGPRSIAGVPFDSVRRFRATLLLRTTCMRLWGNWVAGCVAVLQNKTKQNKLSIKSLLSNVTRRVSFFRASRDWKSQGRCPGCVTKRCMLPKVEPFWILKVDQNISEAIKEVPSAARRSTLGSIEGAFRQAAGEPARRTSVSGYA